MPSGERQGAFGYFAYMDGGKGRKQGAEAFGPLAKSNSHASEAVRNGF